MPIGFLSLQFALSALAISGGIRKDWNSSERGMRSVKGDRPWNVWVLFLSPSLIVSIGLLWSISILAAITQLPPALLGIIWTLAFARFIHAASKAWKIQWKPKDDEPMEVQRRLIQLQHQLHKLNEKEALGLQLEKTNQSQQILNRYGEHFKRVLLTIENHLIYGEHDHAEHVITLFSRHLRQLLHEGSSPFLSLEDSISHIKTHLELMALLTGERFICDVDDGMLDKATLKRCTERFQLGPWVEESVWPYFSLAERSLKSLDPITLIIDVEEDRLTLTFYGNKSSQSEALNAAHFRLLGSSGIKPTFQPRHSALELASIEQ